MSWFYRNIIRPVLFNHDSEEIHDQTLSVLSRISSKKIGCAMLSSFYGISCLPTRVFGIDFPNPVGLAAGMDKKATAVPAWEAFGFGFAELGGVTWHPQPGNPEPRMFRIVEDQALINRMGFNNPGAEVFADRLNEWHQSGLWPRHPIGINLGKSKITPLEEAASDYANSFRKLRPFADFFVVNVSSPNTPNLRQLQDKEALSEILTALNEINRSLAGPAKPILVKVAPDLTFSALDEIAELILTQAMAGIVVANTTLTRPPNGAHRSYAEAGGLSGKPLKERSSEIIRHLFRATGGKVPIIGVGGISDAADAWEKITLGASLVQVYTGLVYEGPSIARNICDGLSELLRRRGLRKISDAVGIENR